VKRALTATLWLGLLGGYLLLTLARGWGPLDVLTVVVRTLVEHPLGPLLYLLMCVVRPLFVFSSSVLSIGAGMLYGPALGFVVVTLGHNLGALLAYALARTLGAGFVEQALARLPQATQASLRLWRDTHAFEGVLTLRLVFTPFDAVNFAAGAARIPIRPFAAATALGSMLGSFTFLFFGASIDGVEALAERRLPSLTLESLLLSLALLTLSLTISRVVRRRTRLQGVEP
jgi:uncharacterized membrane protein YdjX (TVP38/TMEM64 family)